MVTTNYHPIIKSFVISFLYVGIGTLSLISLYPQSGFYTPISWGGLLLTFPVTIYSFGIMYTESNSLDKILNTQLVVFLCFWSIIYVLILLKKSNNHKIRPTEPNKQNRNHMV